MGIDPVANMSARLNKKLPLGENEFALSLSAEPLLRRDIDCELT